MADATLKEQYTLNYFDSLRLLMAEQEDLKRAATSAKLTSGERARAAAAYLDITSRIARFENVHEALIRKFTAGAIKPPSQLLVDTTQALEAKLGKLVATQREYAAILAGVTSFVSEWAALPTEAVAGAAAQDGVVQLSEKTSHLAFIGPA